MKINVTSLLRGYPRCKHPPIYGTLVRVFALVKTLPALNVADVQSIRHLLTPASSAFLYFYFDIEIVNFRKAKVNNSPSLNNNSTQLQQASRSS